MSTANKHAPRGRTCRAEHNGYACTRPRGHKGGHVARGVNGVALSRWSRKPARATAEGVEL